ncbi:Gfo/Idh/MocA family protein [Streptomyces sp. NPDC002285]
MKIGIIGAGNIAQTHARAVRAYQGAELSGVFDIDGAKAEMMARKFSSVALSQADELYEHVQGVIIASPNHSHAHYAAAALARGKHILCEKPMATSVDEATRMQKLATESDSVCSIGFNYRQIEAMLILRDMISKKLLGDILFIQLGLNRDSAVSRKRYTWRDGDRERVTSGALGDLGVHLIDLLNFLFESSVDLPSCNVKLQVNVPFRQGRRVKVDDHSFVSGRLENGIHFTLTATKSSPPEELGFSVRVIGGRGEFRYASVGEQAIFFRSGIDWEASPLSPLRCLADPPGEVVGWGDSFLRQLVTWTDAVNGKWSTSLAGFEAGLNAQRTLESLLLSGGVNSKLGLHP